MEDALCGSLGRRVSWTRPRGGFFLWAEFEPHVHDLDLFEHAIANKVSFVVGSAFYVNGQGHRYAKFFFAVEGELPMRHGLIASTLLIPLMACMIAAGCSGRFETADEEAAKAITALNGTQMDGRALNVNEAKPKTAGSAPRGGGGYSRDRDNYRGR